MDYLINAYPEFTTIDDLPIEDGTSEDKVNLTIYTAHTFYISNDLYFTL